MPAIVLTVLGLLWSLPVPALALLLAGVVALGRLPGPLWLLAAVYRAVGLRYSPAPRAPVA